MVIVFGDKEFSVPVDTVPRPPFDEPKVRTGTPEGHIQSTVSMNGREKILHLYDYRKEKFQMNYREPCFRSWVIYNDNKIPGDPSIGLSYVPYDSPLNKGGSKGVA